MNATLTPLNHRKVEGAEFTVHVSDAEVLNPLLEAEHYLGPLRSNSLVLIGIDTWGDVVAGQVWRRTPASRHLPNDGTWLELSRWVLTPAAGPNAGSRFHSAAIRILRKVMPDATTLVSYSDRKQGHTGALYRACNWSWAPTWHRLRVPPTGGGDWGTGEKQEPKDRWVFALRPDARREGLLLVKDKGAIRKWQAEASAKEVLLARRSASVDLREAAIAMELVEPAAVLTPLRGVQQEFEWEESA